MYAIVWLLVFPSRMLAKEYSLSKKQGWESYKQKTWFLLPKLFGSDVLSYVFYACLFMTVYFVYTNGGVE